MTERLEEIKENWKATGFSDPWDDDIEWLIQQAERVEELEELRRQDNAKMGKLADEINDLREEKYQDPRQGMLEDLYVENQRYRVAIENIEQQIKKNDEQIEWLSKEHQSNYKSRQVEALYGEALGLEMALWIINQALKGESQ